ncbi:ABC transporter permease [Parendozoicomonas haliclonae]|uniref:Iron-uptake system permease protein FeuB n=1 Tax=Parendozoicomonas haliclonae TaxID=1960125 RepID=A0A1X7AK76_9GAMM|nr:iron chelate uptake ABC transporter family permease subunit [Parendozoicomonas haliclonae]SMA47636.1 Iron-uptake system permease protein FeuB [Parendozoicomonas haliclonae]
MALPKVILSTLLLAALALASLMIGAAQFSLSELLQGDAQAWSITVISRIPRLFAVVLAGGGLSVAGLIMQQITQNRFASPSTVGTIDCAMLGYIVGLALFSDASQWSLLGVIFAFAVGGTLIFVKFLQRLKFKNAVLVPLIGMMYGNVVSALTTFMAYRFDLIQSMSSWTTANFASVLQGSYEVLYLAVPVCVLAYLYASQFSAASIGESFAKNIGLNFEKIVFIGVALVAVSTASVVMIVGVIPFLGLIIPNIVSLFMGDNMRRILPWTAYWGVVLVLVCDIIGRLVIFPYEMPISLIISIIGGGVFIYLVLRDKANV